MFCDADDMFYNACGLYILFREINKEEFDTLASVFVEEYQDVELNQPSYINHPIDSTFVHGKVHRRQYLIDNNIRWNEKLTIHEDSYFNILCQTLTNKIKFCPSPFYLWKWRDESVCRHDPKYILKTYNNFIDSSTELVNVLIKKEKRAEAEQIVTTIIYDTYYLMNQKEWLDQENQEYRILTERRFKEYFLEFKDLFDNIPENEKAQIIIGLKNKNFSEGLMLESITFNDWIKHILEYYKE